MDIIDGGGAYMISRYLNLLLDSDCEDEDLAAGFDSNCFSVSCIRDFASPYESSFPSPLAKSSIQDESVL